MSTDDAFRQLERDLTARNQELAEEAMMEQMRSRAELMKEIQALRQRNARLATEVAGLQARLDAHGDYAVYVVPGQPHLREAIEHLARSADLREGDHLRIAGATGDYIWAGGTWQPPDALHDV